MKINNKSFLILSSLILVLFILFVSSYGYDNAVMNFMHHIRSNTMDFWMLFSTHLGSLLTFFILCLTCVLVLDYKDGKKVFILLLMTLFCNMLLKYVVARPRPDMLVMDEIGFSFPSCHAMLSLTFYGYLAFLMNKSKARLPYKILFNGLMIFLITLIGFSRIYLNVHYLSDVAGGYLFGFILLVCFVYLSNMKIKKRSNNGSLIDSFKYAFRGMWTVMFHERNMNIHLAMAFFVTLAGLTLEISKMEWFTCLILFAIVMSAEIFNTAIEKCVDYISLEKNELAKQIKDMAAGGVLITAIIAAIIGLIIFVPKILALLI